MAATTVIIASYSGFLKEEATSVCAAAIKALTEGIRRSTATTLMGLRNDLMQAGEALKQCDDAPISIESLCELFVRFVTRTALDVPDFGSCKALLIERGEMFAQKAQAARDRIAQLGAPFVTDGAMVLTHGYSRMVLGVLLAAAARGCHFSVLVAESHSGGGGHATAHELARAGVPVTMIEDAAVAHAMARTSLCLSGAEAGGAAAVVESGGVLSKTGTFQIAIVAAACKKPFYIAAESTKFARKFPLSQLDLPAAEARASGTARGRRGPPPPTLRAETPSRDYTPPSYITMLFTDLGVLTPSAVSDELIKLFT
ncbi:hypothetical protein EMIHUDRAFT_68766 [Emiliania huxleyi CCMP1516]|uniref:Translation initiation factor eIF2B subunit alpha n=2 Tax=Emiliania huxleyi TaxID=2903 RepID=A0A0D3I487_EMIH1|nr:hypothetical protein EMIHUDRAFT_68766 [Emiliania huxleyi CCMP1516]EOD06072.1 hypothetical protein EMIHUDRAFT_68766 [Emiliania huxleyi CCMP1516]|eukprot:XP_005758501.1 hypothetical protein EMIHUDRAFT_68766 [Emiliania huxleyi CCMP1516]